MQKGSQTLSERVDEDMRQVLRAGSERGSPEESRVPGINGQPEPLHLPMAAQPGAQCVQVQVREPQMAEEALVQDVRVHGLRV